jgi:hypothetical protein
MLGGADPENQYRIDTLLNREVSPPTAPHQTAKLHHRPTSSRSLIRRNSTCREIQRIICRRTVEACLPLLYLSLPDPHRITKLRTLRDTNTLDQNPHSVAIGVAIPPLLACFRPARVAAPLATKPVTGYPTTLPTATAIAPYKLQHDLK